jgi:cell division septation protein DedD
LAAHTDDGFHEIQLNGKQLVFLFMAATVVSVVIFLCGVLVGRGVRAERSSAAEAADLSNVAEPAPQAAAAPTTLPPGSDPTAAAAPPATEDLSYFNRLDTTKAAPKEVLKAQPSAPKAAEPPAPTPLAAPGRAEAVRPQAAPKTPAKDLKEVKEPAPAAPAAQAGKTAQAATSGSEPSSGGYAVQIAALNIRSEADAIAKRFASKGYAAYVMSPALGSPQIYRVRIGKFGSRREAESIATKLEKEEQLKPWVTR